VATNTLAKATVDAGMSGDLAALFERSLLSVRDDMAENPYILEALRVLPARGYRSAIGSFWNAVVDDLRNKIMHRSLSLFNKTVRLPKEIKTYEDFQNHVSDDQLIEGAYNIGVIGWEASKILKHAKETRHIFDGHPKSSEPSIIKVLGMMDDCIKYVLKAEYPYQIVDIDEYMSVIGSGKFDRNRVAIETALGDLPEVYKNELANRLFSGYIHPDSSTILRSNIEFAVPILWRVLPKEVKVQIVRRVDQIIAKGDIAVTEQGFAFVQTVRGMRYLSQIARRYKVQPLVKKLRKNLDNWSIEDEAVRDLEIYAPYIPLDLLPGYVSALTHTFVGHMGSSAYYARRDFYADGAALLIPKMFEAFDDRAAEAFVEAVKSSKILRTRLHYPAKLSRLRALGNIVLEKVSEAFPQRDFLEALSDESKEERFFRKLGH
jgi:hypothetical protein